MKEFSEIYFGLNATFYGIFFEIFLQTGFLRNKSIYFQVLLPESDSVQSQCGSRAEFSSEVGDFSSVFFLILAKERREKERKSSRVIRWQCGQISCPWTAATTGVLFFFPPPFLFFLLFFRTFSSWILFFLEHRPCACVCLYVCPCVCACTAHCVIDSGGGAITAEAVALTQTDGHSSTSRRPILMGPRRPSLSQTKEVLPDLFLLPCQSSFFFTSFLTTVVVVPFFITRCQCKAYQLHFFQALPGLPCFFLGNQFTLANGGTHAGHFLFKRKTFDQNFFFIAMPIVHYVPSFLFFLLLLYLVSSLGGIERLISCTFVRIYRVYRLVQMVRGTESIATDMDVPTLIACELH